ncbi:hypothetical protein AU106_gp242 [Sinorhizobium phage phiM9]|uniref:Uncharacterized protein n=1 Tax=Sinorhizobium phage phiM9 TaxID=1636182 RepID=A0A0F6R7S0_9CAUD|nr:hypothetical protein AU106_gp242 [Sinorhizobium phage phiM9]AKE44873.1 hypothetical protein Sm_phiM9_246 [Sinorhizobium phage phiM9]
MNATNGAPEYATNKSDLYTYTWLDERSVNGLSVQSLKGVLSSLVKKNLVTVSKDSEGDYLNFTDLGFETVMNLIPKKETKIVEKIEDTLEEEEVFIHYRFKKISDRFNEKTPEKLDIFVKSNIGLKYNSTEDTWYFKISAAQKEDLIKAIRATKIFSRMTQEKLEKFLDK